MFYSIMTKNLNLETKNLATFKRWDGWEFTEKFDFFFFGGGGLNRLKRGTWIVCRFKSRLGKRMGYVFEVGGEGCDPNAHYELEEPSY